VGTICRSNILGENIHLVTIDGDLDAPNAGAVKSYLLDLISGGASRLVIDLNGVRVPDSMGLTALISTQMKARSKGGDIMLLFDNPQLKKLFRITGLDEYIRIITSVAEIPEISAR
jgi:anti-sigma B factor antagonist